MIFNFEIPLNGQKVSARAFTYKEFQELQTARVENKTREAICKLIEDCTGIDANSLPSVVAEYLFLQLWIKSMDSETTTATWVCGVCGNEKEYTLDLTKARVEFINGFDHRIGGITFHFRLPKFSETADPIEMIISCIEYLVIDGEQFELNDLTNGDFETVLGMMTQEHVDGIIESLTNNKVTLAVPIKCSCGESGVYALQGLTEIFEVIQ